MITPVCIVAGVLLLVLGYAWLLAHTAHRGGVAAFLRARSNDWVETLDLQRVFGHEVYNTLDELKHHVLVERKEEFMATRLDARGGHPIVSYRWIGP